MSLHNTKAEVVMWCKLRFLYLILSVVCVACTSTIPSHLPTADPVGPTPSVNTPTSALNPAQTHTPKPIFSPVATLTTSEKKNLVNNLLLTNGGCELPCWWGFTPGKTSWTDIEAFFTRFSATILPFERDEGYTHYYVEFDIENENFVYDFFVDNNNIVEVILGQQHYSIHDFLVLYGQPREIWLYSDGEVPGPSFIRVILFYPDKGILSLYWGKSNLIRRNSKNHLITCVADLNNLGSLWLWSPSPEIDLEGLLTTTEKLPDMKFRRLGETTNYDEESFFDSILASESDVCLDTLSEIWPGP